MRRPGLAIQAGPRQTENLNESYGVGLVGSVDRGDLLLGGMSLASLQRWGNVRIDRTDYRKTSTYAFRRLAKALRNLGRAILQEPTVSWIVRLIK